MLSDEEKQGIEYLKRHIIPCYGRKGTIEFMLNDTLLNLIEKQSKEIEELKKPKYIINCKTNEITKLTNDFVSKDKIKAKIKELEKLNDESTGIGYWFAIYYLQSLLEKE